MEWVDRGGSGAWCATERVDVHEGFQARLLRPGGNGHGHPIYETRRDVSVRCGAVPSVSDANIPNLLPLFLLACCLTLAYETTGSLWVSVTMHSAFNALNLVLTLYQP